VGLLLSLGAIASVAAVEDYVIGANDVLNITIFGEPLLTGKYIVQADGTFTFPLLGRLKAGGLSMQALENELRDRLVKGAFLALYVVGVTRVPRYRRIFSYHGAEHMAIACAGAGLPLNTANLARFSPAHPRCGTGFLVILAAVDTLLLAALPRLGPLPDMALRIGFVPITAAIAYELLRWGSRRRGIGFALNRFGLFTQRLTTAQPDASQLEVAAAALERCRSGAPVTAQVSAAAPLPVTANLG